MKPMQIPIPAIGNFRGIVIPKRVLAQAGFEATFDLTVESSAIVLRKPAGRIRAGLSEAARWLAEHGGDAPVIGEFANTNNAELVW